MGILLCEQHFLDVWIRNKSVRAEIGHILRTHTHAAKLVVEITSVFVQAFSWNIMIRPVEIIIAEEHAVSAVK